MKLAFHDSGVVYYAPEETDKQPVSTPRTISSHGDDGLRVPQSAVRRLRSSLRDVYPELAEKPFAGTRLCWWAIRIHQVICQAKDGGRLQVHGLP